MPTTRERGPGVLHLLPRPLFSRCGWSRVQAEGSGAGGAARRQTGVPAGAFASAAGSPPEPLHLRSHRPPRRNLRLPWGAASGCSGRLVPRQAGPAATAPAPACPRPRPLTCASAPLRLPVRLSRPRSWPRSLSRSHWARRPSERPAPSAPSNERAPPLPARASRPFTPELRPGRASAVPRSVVRCLRARAASRGAAAVTGQVDATRGVTSS